jgi:hypothetical protein
MDSDWEIGRTDAFIEALRGCPALIIRQLQGNGTRDGQRAFLKRVDEFVEFSDCILSLTKPDERFQEAKERNGIPIPGFYFVQVGLWRAYCKIDCTIDGTKNVIHWILPEHESFCLRQGTLKAALAEAARSIS